MNFTQPIDMPRNTHYGNNYFTVYSNKIHRVCHFYSNLEYFNFLSLEINPNVKEFCEQPLKIEIVQENKIKHAIFDMWVKYKDGSEEFQEVKYYAEVTGTSDTSIRSQEQIKREKAWCKENNIKFVIRTEKEISKGRFFLDNANIISSRLRRYIPSDDLYYNNRIIKALTDYNKLTIEELIKNELLPINNELNYICYLYEKGVITMNINNKPLDNRMEVTLWGN